MYMPSKVMPGGPYVQGGISPQGLMQLANSNFNDPQAMYRAYLQAMAMGMMPEGQMIAQREAAMPDFLQYSNADAIAQRAGDEYARTTIKPEYAKAVSANSNGGLGAPTSSFKNAKNGYFRAALEKNRMAVQDNAKTAAIQQINAMRSGATAYPQNNMSSIYQPLQDIQRMSGYGSSPYGGASQGGFQGMMNNIGGIAGSGVEFLQALKNINPVQNPVPQPSMGGLPGRVLGAGASLLNNMWNSL